MTKAQALTDILEMARWAPSGDNTQPWRFEIVDDQRFIIHAHDTRDHCVYDLDGHPSQLAHGALLETLAIAASAYEFRADFKRDPESAETHPNYLVELHADSQITPDPLLPSIQQRSVRRRPMRISPLTKQQKLALESSVEKLYTIKWFENNAVRLSLAKLMFDNAKLRLTLPEAYPVHRDIIAWQSRFSEDKVPDQALGLDAVTLKLMRWVMGSWQRVKFFNRWLAGHLMPRLQMDLLPGFFCGAHFVIVAKKPPATIDDYVTAGRAIQRFWLTATSLNLQMQPEMTPVIFGRYAREGRVFSHLPRSMQMASDLNARLSSFLQDTAVENVAFLGRIGAGRPTVSRSLRLPLSKLMSSQNSIR